MEAQTLRPFIDIPCHLSTQSSRPTPTERGTTRAHTILVALGATNSFVRAASSTPAFQTVQYSVFRLGMGAGSRRISLEFVAKRKTHPLANWSGPRLSCGPALIRAPPPLGISGYRPHILARPSNASPLQHTLKLAHRCTL